MEKIKKVIKRANWQLLGKISYLVVLVVLFVVAAVTISSALEIPGGFRLFSVQSGSMAPKIPIGSLVVTKPFDGYKKGDVITFKAETDRLVKNPKNTTTHRIVGVKERGGNTLYETKGDANNAADMVSTDGSLVLGKVLLSLPLMGYVVSFSRTIPGLVVLIVIPATMIIYSEVLNIKKEVTKLLAGRRGAKEHENKASA